MFENKYAKLIQHTLDHGKVAEGRNGATVSTFGQELIIPDMRDKFPLLLGRRMYPKGIIGEFSAFLSQPNCVKDFEDKGCNYWKQWADEFGGLELDYGNAWIDFEGVNQLQGVIGSLKTHPHTRRHLISAWRPDRLDDLSLPCCHYAYQFYVNARNELELIWIQRSVDLMIGLPSDIVLAKLLQVMVASLTGYGLGKITMQLGDCHVYQEHVWGAIIYLNRVRDMKYKRRDYPTYKYEEISSYEDVAANQHWLTPNDYHPHFPIKFELKE